jgi:hypothetical protein
MGKVIGEVFDPFVQKQIAVRQEKLGKHEYDTDLLTYTTSKDSWLRLSSGVDIDETKLDTIPGTPIGDGGIPAGSGLAKRYVLFGGANNITKSSKPKGGIVSDYTNSVLANASYGFDSSAEYGLTPLPGVTSFNIKPKNNGSLIEGEVKIKCYNVQQFNHIESLYLRLGYTLLLEWGHTIYYQNNGKLNNNITNNIDTVYKNFLKGTSDSDHDPQTYTLNVIKQARSDSSGNYDAMIGRVLNYNWDVSPEGEYNITVKVLSPGDVIESLSVSAVLPGPKLVEDSEEEDTSGIENKIESTAIGRILTGFKIALDGSPKWFQRNTQTVGDVTALGTIIQDTHRNFGQFGIGSYFDQSLTNKRIMDASVLPDLTPYNDDVPEMIGPSNLNEVIPFKELIKIQGEKIVEEYYIKFGALLRIIQNFLLLYNTSDTTNNPIVGIDWKYDNKCFIPVENLFSSDPRICQIPSNFKNTKPPAKDAFKFSDSFKRLNSILGTDFLPSNTDLNQNEYSFMHIHLNIDMVLKILEDNINSSGNLALIDFLIALCNQINSSLSSTTEFAPFVDTDDNILYIVNKRNSDPIIPPEKRAKPSKFQIGFLHSGKNSEGKSLPDSISAIKEGSFVKSFSINSTIPPNFATQIAIGAQANNTSIDSNSFALSNWNKGYTDRIVLEKSTSENTKTAAEEKAEADKVNKYENTEKNAKLAAFQNALFRYDDSLYKLSTDVNNFFKIKSSDNIKNKETAGGVQYTSPFLIPISLSLNLDGLSGMKIFQKYTITDEFLPQSYRDNIEFIIKSINHTIDDSGWTTNVEGQFMPKPQPVISSQPSE